MHLTSIPDLKASVWSEGAELREYDNPDEDETEGSISKYIEAIDGATFEIEVEVSSSYVFKFHHLAAFVYVDGIIVHGKNIRPDTRKTRIVGRYEEQASGDSILRRLLFNRIETTEDHDNGKDTQNLDLIGEIEVKVFQMLKDGPPIPFVPHAADARGVERLSEKKIKGRSISHGTMYAPPEKTTKYTYAASVYAEGKNKSLAVFKFLYKSKAALQAMLVIPRTPSPDPPSPSVRSRSKPNVKMSSSQKDSKVKLEKRVKRELDEGSQSGSRKKRHDGTSMIDLTGDDDDEPQPSAVIYKRFKTQDGKQGIDLT